MHLATLLMTYEAFGLHSCRHSLPELYVCLDAAALDKLRVKEAEKSQLLLEADKLLTVIEEAEPSIGDRVALRAYLSRQTGKLVALVPDGASYIFRFVQ